MNVGVQASGHVGLGLGLKGLCGGRASHLLLLRVYQPHLSVPPHLISLERPSVDGVACVGNELVEASTKERQAKELGCIIDEVKTRNTCKKVVVGGQ